MAEDEISRDLPAEQGDPLNILCVIDRMDVGPVRVERNRLLSPYRVTVNDHSDTEELIYRFEQSVFAPDETASVNLASMIAAQVAINYGLFCKDIVFHGLFDRHDQRLIKEAAENTAREIFVKKFLEPNPFLVGAAAKLRPVKARRFLRAHLLFENREGAPPAAATKPQPWSVSASKHAVLSSGGKDSLLSFSLLKEMGFEVHPIFLNESGRHWFTALNAYRYFAGNIPNTARVWTNADRVYNWMLRHFPFVRHDHASIRSDEYPIRLWTVAVFLFGALPLLRKRGIGRLVIGDEYDTTRRLSYQGITHYDGLYDQSRYFDNTLTRYFQSKGWGVRQFSLLRPLSELLIEKVLVERYPEVQRLQVSCHAAHKEGERVKPCGRCEKCRRIVGMLLALGGDPTKCGYTSQQIEHCLRTIAVNGVHQISDDAEHLAFLLREKGLIEGTRLGKVRARSRGETMKVRFDPERSPVEDVPVDIRESLYRIYLQHAEGAVSRSGRVWNNFDPLEDPAVKLPYAFETPRRSEQ
ncbi:MAG: hypothetical protein P8175_03505 [Deltaproteobacteria bacterium]|jgi:hypothetical protein